MYIYIYTPSFYLYVYNVYVLEDQQFIELFVGCLILDETEIWRSFWKLY